jgi:hypothetical protein
MSIESLSSHEIEQDRQRQVRELSSECGAEWSEEYRPGSTGCHELLDRTSLVADMIQRHILTHPACVARPEWYRLAEQAAAALLELYQQVGSEHLAVEDPHADHPV